MEVYIDCHTEKIVKCTKPFALNAVKNVLSHSNLTEADPYTAENVMQNEDHPEDIKPIS